MAFGAPGSSSSPGKSPRLVTSRVPLCTWAAKQPFGKRTARGQDACEDSLHPPPLPAALSLAACSSRPFQMLKHPPTSSQGAAPLRTSTLSHQQKQPLLSVIPDTRKGLISKSKFLFFFPLGHMRGGSKASPCSCRQLFLLSKRAPFMSCVTVRSAGVQHGNGQGTHTVTGKCKWGLSVQMVQ